MDGVIQYFDLAMTQFCPGKGKIEELEDYYQSIVPVCVDYCLHLDRMLAQLLFYFLLVGGVIQYVYRSSNDSVLSW